MSEVASPLHRSVGGDGPSNVLLSAGDVTIGGFRCAPTASNFRTAGAITRHCFVFPRRAVWIQHEGQAPFVADPTRITLYNPQEISERRVLDPGGDYSDWIEVSDAVVREVVACYDPAAAESPARALRHTHAPARSELYLAQRSLYEYVQRHRAIALVASSCWNGSDESFAL